MNTRIALVLLASALLHAADAQPRTGIDGTDLLLAQQAALADTRPSPSALHDLTASATRFAVWNFDAMAYDTLRFRRHPVPPNAHHAGWAKFLRLWVEEREVQSGRVTTATLDSMALDFGTNLPWAVGRLSWRAGAPQHAALDSAQGVDLLLLDIRDGYSPATDTAWIAGFMDRCDTKVWDARRLPMDGRWQPGQPSIPRHVSTAREGPGLARPYERLALRPPRVVGVRPCKAAPAGVWRGRHRPPRLRTALAAAAGREDVHRHLGRHAGRHC